MNCSLRQSPMPAVRHDPLFRCLATLGDDDCAGELIGHGVCLAPAASATRVFDWVRDLSNLAVWWPGVRGVQSLPPGVHGVGDMGLLATDHGPGWFRVLAFRPRRRIVLALHAPGRLQMLDLRIADESPCRLHLRVEAPRRPGPWRGLWQALHLRRQCARAALALELQLRQLAA